MTDRHRKYLYLARRIAMKATGLRRMFGCVIVQGSKVVAVGKNKKSHPMMGEGRFSLHAEIDALLKCSFDVNGASVFLWGLNAKTKNTINSQPCSLCREALVSRGIRNVVHVIRGDKIVMLNLRKEVA